VPRQHTEQYTCREARTSQHDFDTWTPPALGKYFAAHATVDGLVVHAIFAPGALACLRTAGMRILVSCDTGLYATHAIGVALLIAALQEGLL
jgi:hypothetical protein